jgi:outer membrane PBP1 activator LpoA protein
MNKRIAISTILTALLVAFLLASCTPDTLVIKEQNGKQVSSKKLLSNGRYSYELNSKDWNLTYESSQDFQVGDTLIIVSKSQMLRLKELLTRLKVTEELEGGEDGQN